jgi:hypothetical protein
LLNARSVPARIVIIASSLAALALLVASPNGLFSGDEGIKLAETQGLAFTGYRDASLYDPGASLAGDRKLDAFAAAETFTFRTGDKIYGTYPLVFPAVAAPLYLIAGVRGMALVSLAAFVAVLIWTARLARRCMLSERATAAAVAIAGVGCSLPLYATTLYEHTAATALLLAAINVTLDGRRMALAGALLGLATCMRTELYAFAPAMAIVVWWAIGVRWRAWPRWLAFGGGAVAVVATFLSAHRVATGAWHPTLKASANGDMLTLYGRLEHVVQVELLPWALIPLAFTLAAAAFRPRTVVTAAIAMMWCAMTYFAIRSDARTVTGLFTTTPVIALALTREVLHRQSPLGALVLAAAVFVTTLVLLPKASANGGLELGARYLLPVVPLFAIGAAAAARRSRACWAVLFAASVCATAVNARTQWRIREVGAHIVTAIERANAPVVMTEIWWVAQLAVPAQKDGVSLYVGHDRTAIYDRLYALGVRRVLALRGRPPPASGRVRLRLAEVGIVDDPRISPQVYELVSR